MMQTHHPSRKLLGKPMNRKAYLKDPYADTPPIPFARFDYLLCAIAFCLLSIASLPQIAGLIVPAGK